MCTSDDERCEIGERDNGVDGFGGERNFHREQDESERVATLSRVVRGRMEERRGVVDAYRE
jgi:hypothetical protein